MHSYNLKGSNGNSIMRCCGVKKGSYISNKFYRIFSKIKPNERIVIHHNRNDYKFKVIRYDTPKCCSLTRQYILTTKRFRKKYGILIANTCYKLSNGKFISEYYSYSSSS